MEDSYKNFVFLRDYVGYCNGPHPAARIPFDVLYEELKKRENEGLVSCSKTDGLEIFKYTMTTVTDKKWDYFTLLARGIILSPNEKKIVGFSFPKFFNYGEAIDIKDIVQQQYLVTEKIDGSLGIVFNYNGKWMVSTMGSFVSDQAQWATKWIHKYLPLEKMDISNTYLFEIIYAENKIVINYDFEGLVLLGIYDQFGLEYSYDMLKKESEYMGVKITIVHDFADMNSILSQTKDLDKDHEGYVIRFSNGVRLKVKGDEYVRIHRLMSKVTPLFIWASMLQKDNLDEIKRDLPEEMTKDFENIVSILSGRLEAFKKDVSLLYENTKHMSDKNLGIMMSEHPEFFSGGEFKESVKYVYPMRKGKFFGPLEDPSSILRRKVFSVFKPKSNFLPGYTPSSLTNRFVEDL